MCNFFSFCADGHGNYFYADWEQRKSFNFQDCDSHSAILTRAGIKASNQDRYSFYEYNPLTKSFIIDKAIKEYDTEAAHNWVEARDWKTIVEPLIIKPILNPFFLKPPKITEKYIKLLKQWASVGVSVWDSVGASVEAYISSLFTIEYKYDLSSVIKLWESGLVPSFDGKTWRLHGGKNAQILYKWTPSR